jgi:FkbM family methyltransferase
MWRYIHARTVARVWPRLKRPVPDISPAVDRFLRRTIETRERFSVLQVGAYDGISNDPLHDLIQAYPHLRAVLLEPQAEPYAALQAQWAGCSRVVPLQKALADACGERPLYVVAESDRHRHPFAGQIASFSRAHVEFECARYIWRPSRDVITSIAVPTIDWRTLVERHGPFDYVTIDVEGYDGEVLQQMDFTNTPPEIIRYEYRHLTGDGQQRAARRLEQAGYVLRRIDKADTLAIRSGLSPAFSE